MPRKRKNRRLDCECGTVLVLSPTHATDDFLDYIRAERGAFDWDLVERWEQAGTGYLVLHMGAEGGNLFELVARDDEELLGVVLDRLARKAQDITITQAGGIGTHELLEAFNARWVALGGLPNPQFDRSICLH